MNNEIKRHWTQSRDEDSIEWLTLDRADTSTNTLSAAVLQELLQILQDLQENSLPKALVIQSGKSNGFIAGADIEQFKGLEAIETASALIKQGQMVFNYLAELSIPTVALIEGFCLGGGLELALACRHRIAIDDPKTRLGLPEVKLGIHPGWGGTIRLPRLIGVLGAMDLILSGRTVNATTAYKMGMVDAVVAKRQAESSVALFLKKNPSQHRPAALNCVFEIPLFRKIAGRFLYKKLTSKIDKAHYPAPYAAVDNWVKCGIKDDAAYMVEAKSVSELVLTNTAHNLLRVFSLQEKLKSIGKESTFKLTHVHVIGAGTMGGDIAAWCALHGMQVTLQDVNKNALASALGRAAKLFNKKLKDLHLVHSAMDRLVPDSQGEGIKRADLFIEAIVEKLEVKQQLFKALESKARPEAIFATNTSTIPLEEIGMALENPKRLVGLHFFNPVAQMPLVEVVRGQSTSPEVFHSASAFVKHIQKLPLPVKSSPGFLVNRILLPYLIESVLLVESGVPARTVDKAAVAFGMPMGPIELADTVGLDVCLYCAESLQPHYGGSIPETLITLVKEKHFGCKTGQGFYHYRHGKRIPEKSIQLNRLPEDVIDRLILSMLNRSVACLREQVVESGDLLDAGMIFGAGFPPFRGGPMHYIAAQGKTSLEQKLVALAERYGERFSPDEYWSSLRTL